MSRVVAWFRNPGNRGYLYRVLAALGLVAVGYGLITGEELALLGGFLAVLFNVTPTLNTPTGAQLRAFQQAGRERGLEPEPYSPGPGRDVRRKFDR